MIRTAWAFLRALIPTRADARGVGWRGLVAALLSAALMRGSFPPFDCEWMIWFALVPVLFASRAMEARHARWTWYLFGVAFWYSASVWLNSTSYVNSLVYVGTVLMALILGLWMVAFAWTLPHLRRLGPISLLIIPMVWIALEQMRGWGDLRFPWFYLAHTQWQRPEMIQSASLFGTHGLGYLIALLNITLAEALARRWKKSDTHPFAISAAVLVFIGLYLVNALVGNAKLAQWSERDLGPSVRVALLQTNWTQLQKMITTNPAPALDDLLDLAREVEPGSVDVIIGHEICVLDDLYPISSQRVNSEIRAVARTQDAAFVFGANNASLAPGVTNPRTMNDLIHRNAAWAMSASGEIFEPYDKVELVPFGESAPIVGRVPGLVDLLLGMVVINPGSEVRNLPIRVRDLDFPLGVHVCFESSIPWLVRQFTAEGAQALATITNDAWFLDTVGPTLHWTAQPFRAVENRRWIVQAAQTGVSSIVDPAGNIIARTPMLERTALTGQIELLEGLTVYTRHGDWLAHMFLLLSAAAMGAAHIRKRRGSSAS